MTRRMFALVGGDGVATEYASPAEGRDGELYTSRLVADPAYVEVDFETREPLKASAKPETPAPPAQTISMAADSAADIAEAT